MSSLNAYWQASRQPRYSLLFALPLLLLYEILAFTLSGDGYAGIRNGADVLLKSLFVTLGGHRGLLVFSVLLLGIGLALVWRDLRARGGVQLKVFGLMLVESVAYALVFGLVTSVLTTLLLPDALLAMGVPPELSLATQLVISLGAGIYEELLFRVLLVSGLAALATRVFKFKPVPAGIFATVLGALIFSAFHYIGAFGDPFTLGSFTFRAIAGALFSGLYLLRGFGITAWTHALYDVFLTLRM